MECPNCAQRYSAVGRKPIDLGCGHTYCQECVSTNSEKFRKCPECRLPATDPHVNIALLRLISESGPPKRPKKNVSMPTFFVLLASLGLAAFFILEGLLTVPEGLSAPGQIPSLLSTVLPVMPGPFSFLSAPWSFSVPFITLLIVAAVPCYALLALAEEQPDARGSAGPVPSFLHVWLDKAPLLVLLVGFLRTLPQHKKQVVCVLASIALLQLAAVLSVTYTLATQASALVAAHAPLVLLAILLGMLLQVFGVLYILLPVHNDPAPSTNPAYPIAGSYDTGSTATISSVSVPRVRSLAASDRKRNTSFGTRSGISVGIPNLAELYEGADENAGFRARVDALANFTTFMRGLDSQPGAYSLEEFIRGAANAMKGIYPGVHHASFCLLNASRASVNMYTFIGEGSSKPPRINVAVSPGTLIFHVLHTCEPVFISNIALFPGPYSDVQFMRFVLGLQSVACLPLVVAGARVLGVLRLGFEGSWVWEEREKSLTKQLALVLSSTSQSMGEQKAEPRNNQPAEWFRQDVRQRRPSNQSSLYSGESWQSHGNGSAGYGPGSTGYGNGSAGYGPGSTGYGNGSVGYAPSSTGYGNSNASYAPSSVGYGNGSVGYNSNNSSASNAAASDYGPTTRYPLSAALRRANSIAALLPARAGESGGRESEERAWPGLQAGVSGASSIQPGSMNASMASRGMHSRTGLQSGSDRSFVGGDLHSEAYSQRQDVSGSASSIRSGSMATGRRREREDMSMHLASSEQDDMNQRLDEDPAHLRDVKMLEVIGRGGFGSVYKAFWRGQVVAVKVLEHGDDFGTCTGESSDNTDITGRRAALLEGAMTSSIRHENVVATYDYRVVPLCPPPPSPTTASRMQRIAHETHIIMEHCDLGSLHDAVQSRVFYGQAGGAQGPGPPAPKAAGPEGKGTVLDMEAIVLTLIEVSGAMEYLHAHRITHRDLKSKNILLKSSFKDRRGFTAKVSDFGLSQVLPDTEKTQISTKYCGTITHMPPELIEDGKVYHNGDVYAFGIIMWEVYAGSTPYAGMAQPQIMVGVVTHNLRPKFAEDCPDWYKTLAHKCWRKDPHSRPSFTEVSAYLQQMLRDLSTGAKAAAT